MKPAFLLVTAMLACPYREYKAAIRRALPFAKFSGPDVADATSWALDFARTEAADMELLTHHYYRSGAMRPNATIQTLLATDAAQDTTLQMLEQTGTEHGTRFRINEVNSFYGGGKAGVSDTFASALWCLDFLFRLAAHRADGANLEITLPGNCSAASACRLAAPSVASKTQVTLAGQEVSADGTWAPGIFETVPVKAGLADLPLPAASTVVVPLR